MILTIDQLKEKYSDYVNPNTKIGREVKEEKLFKVTRGIYEDDPHVDPMYLAGVIYGPSYLSFQWTLSYYNLMRKKTFTYTSATCSKRRKKEFNNVFGSYTYQDVPKAAFPYGVNLIEKNGYFYMVATKEKALCDTLYSLPPVNSLKALENLLFCSLKIDETDFLFLKWEDILFLCPLYHSKTLNFLSRYIKKEMERLKGYKTF